MFAAKPRLALLAAVVWAPSLAAQDSRLDSLDRFVKEQMTRRQIPAVSLAIIQGGKVVVARAYGIADTEAGTPATTATLFQAGSISKPVSAVAALHLVEQGRLSLDEDVNRKLTSWKVPDNRFTATEKVTLRRLLSHSAGLTVHGFPGYDVADPLPSVVQVLDGAAPANTGPIRVDTTPGAIWRYSGGGYTVMQQMLVDVTGTAFPALVQQTVLAPIGMSSSSFEQPQPRARAALTAAAYYADRTPVRGRWHLYPEMAAAGLWTTATDLARFAIEIQETLAGKGHGVMSQAMARQFITPQKGSSGLGIGVNGADRSLSFSHGGRDAGFDAQLLAFAETGQGAAIMINANDNSRFMGRLLDFLARTWAWPTSAPARAAPAATRAAPIDPALIGRYAGYYEAAENQMRPLLPGGTGILDTYIDGLPDERFLALDSVRFGSTERPLMLSFGHNARGEVDAMLWGPTARRMPRIAPPPSTREQQTDPSPELTRQIGEAMRALEQGSAATAALLTPGAKRDFAGGRDRALEAIGNLRYLGEEDVTGRGIHRHGHPVARVRYFRVTTRAGERFLLAHLTADGLLTDYDVVAR